MLHTEHSEIIRQLYVSFYMTIVSSGYNIVILFLHALLNMYMIINIILRFCKANIIS